MSKKILFIFFPVLITLAIFLALYKGLSMDPHELPSEFINKQAPAIKIADLYQPHMLWNNKLLSTQSKKHWYLVHVWASWCEVCMMEHPFLMDLAHRGVIIYGVDYKDEMVSAKQWLDDYGNPYKAVLWDNTGTNMAKWGTYGVPETFLVDSKGIIRFREAGALTKSIWEKNFLPLIASKEVKEDESV